MNLISENNDWRTIVLEVVVRRRARDASFRILQTIFIGRFSGTW